LDAEAQFFLTMTYHQLGRKIEARQALSEAIATCEDAKDSTPTDRAIYRHLRQEAEALSRDP
jgi:hypothetical protein